MTPAIRTVLFLTALAVLAATSSGLRAKLELDAGTQPQTDEPIYLPRADLLRPLSLGYHNVMADILWFRAISYFGKHYRSDRTYPWLAHICDLVTDLDPLAEHVYRFAGLILPWESGQVDEGIRLLEKGTRALPKSWALAYYLGFNYFFFKGDHDAAARNLQRAVSLPGVHHGVARLAAILTTETAGPAATLAFLRDLEENVDSKQVKAVVQRNIREASAAASIKTLDAAIEAYQRANGRPPHSLDEVVAAGLVPAIPTDPFGGRFRIGPDGKTHSTSGKTPGRTHTSTLRERARQGKSGTELFGQ